MDYNIINKNSIRIVEVLRNEKMYFNQLHEKTKIKSKNNLLRNLKSLTENKVLFKEKNKSNTFYLVNYSNELSIAILNLANKIKFSKLPYSIKKSVTESIFALTPSMAIIFGSYAKENYTKESDVDLLFIDGKKDENKVKEISKNYGVQINIHFIKNKELNLVSDPIMHIFKTGYPLSGAEYFYNEIKKI